MKHDNPSIQNGSDKEVDASASGVAEGRICNFWVCAGLIALLSAALLSREIDRPYYGLHSVDQAHNAWLARSHVDYGLGYTKGYPTFAVGNPPAEVPQRYLDHPVLYALLDAGAMVVFGVNRRALRITNILATIVTLFLFLRIVRALSDDVTALLSGLVLVQLPLIAYFGINQWLYPLCFSALWCYLVLIQGLRRGPQPAPVHLVGLAFLLFIAVQINWQGIFFALAIGVHFLFRSLHRREWPRRDLLAVLVLPPLAGTALNVAILAAAESWTLGRLADLAAWRAGAAEREVHEWVPWFARLWEFAVTNFTWVVLGLALGYLTLGQLALRFAAAEDGNKARTRRTFPQFWLFLMPGIFQIFMLKGVVWEHQWWERPFAPILSIAAALGLLVVADLLGKIHPRLFELGLALGIVGIFVSTMIGTNYYYGVRHYFPERLEMFDWLQEQTPPDKALLSFESYVFDQKPGVKQASYRPQVGWHLNREIVVARTLDEIERAASTGRFTHYLMPANHGKDEVDRYLVWLSQQLRDRYPHRLFRDSPDQWIFDLQMPEGTRR